MMQCIMVVDMGDYYVFNGIKNWIINGGIFKLYLVMVQIDLEKGYCGINCFIVEMDLEGVVIGVKEDKLGICFFDIYIIMYIDVKVFKENCIGEDGFGFKFVMKMLFGGWIGIVVQVLGIVGGVYELVLNYFRECEVFGKVISKYQVIVFKLVDMVIEIEVVKLMVYCLAWFKDNKMDYDMVSLMVKMYVLEVAMWYIVEVVQVYGGYGFVKEYYVECLMCDVKIM